MVAGTLSARRARDVRRLLLVTFGVAGLLLIGSVGMLSGDYEIYGGIVLVIAAALGTSSFLANRALGEGRPQARRLSLVTGALLCVLSVPLMPILVGLVTVLLGIGLLVVVLAPEREAR